MSTKNNKLKLIFIPIICSVLLIGFQKILAGERLPAMTKKNKNEVSNFFNEQINGRDNLEKKMQESRNLGIKQLENKELVNNLGEAGEINNSAEKLKNLDQRQAEEMGYEVKDRNKGYLERSNLNYKDRQILSHKNDIDKIANGTKELIGKLHDKLKNIGVDCLQKKAAKETEAEMFIEVLPEMQKEVIYDKFLCEEARRQYNCRDRLSVKCADLNYAAGSLFDVSGNMYHTLNNNGQLIIGVNQEGYYWNSWGAQNDYLFRFTVNNPAAIERFRFQEIKWADYVLVKLNGNVIFQSPGVNGKIEMSYEKINNRKGIDGKWYHGVDIGKGDYVAANTKRYQGSRPGREAKQFLKNGENILEIRLAYGNGGKIWLALEFKEKKCNKWLDSWDEECKLS